MNIAAIKKHDNMMPVTRNADGTIVNGPISTQSGFSSLYMPSARKLAPTAAGESTRARQQTFSVGYKERVQIDCYGGGVWKWRRVVFSLKGTALFEDPNEEWNDPYLDRSTDPEGCDMVRLINQPTANQSSLIRSFLWDGTENVDWTSEFTAKVDTSRVTPHYDRTYTFNPRNESGFSRTFRMWHPTRKNLIYSEDEEGGLPNGQGWYLSTPGRPGMGDLYVYDIMYLVVQSAAGGATAAFQPEGTYYWHER